MSEQYGNTPRKIQECKNGFKRKWSHYFWHEFVLKNENKVTWSWYWLSSNPNITMEIVEAHPDKPLNWFGLSSNKFTKEKSLFMERKLREHLVAFKIQTYWRRANYNPGYELCKRRLMRECDMFGIE